MKTTSKIVLITIGVILLAAIATKIILRINNNGKVIWRQYNTQLPLNKEIPSFTSIYFEGDNSIKRAFTGHIIIKQGEKPQVNFETKAFEVGTTDRNGATILVINMDKEVVEKQKYGMYALTITIDQPLRNIENEFKNFNIELRGLEGDDLDIIDTVSDGSYVNLSHCTFKNVNLKFNNDNYFWTESGSKIDNVLIQGGVASRKLFDTRNYLFFIAGLDQEGNASIYSSNGYYSLKNKIKADNFRKNCE